METRQFKKLTKKLESQSHLLQKCNANFVNIKQNLINFIDNIQIYKSNQFFKKEIFDTAFTEFNNLTNITSFNSDCNEKSLYNKFSPQNKLNNTGYSLRSFKKLTEKRHEKEQIEDYEHSEISDNISIKIEPIELNTSLIFSSQNQSNVTNSLTKKRRSVTPNSYSKSPSPQSKKRKTNLNKTSLFPTMSALDGRAARYGWFLHDYSNLPIVDQKDIRYLIEDPDDYVCFHERKSWANEYAMCVGQKNLCKWV